MSRLPPPAVAPEAYTEDYYRRVCAGAAEWEPTAFAIGGIYAYALERLALAPGGVLVDIGCGRGELITLAAQHGASAAIGIEYAAAAVDLARQTIATHGVGAAARVLLADARELPLEDGVADAIALLDVVEHLTPQELARTLGETRRVLRPGGRLLVHTFPNRLVYDVTYRLHRTLALRRRSELPREPRLELELQMHVNEQTRRGLRRALRAAGLREVRVEHGEWIHTAFLPGGRGAWIYRALGRVPATRALGRANLLANAIR